LVNVEVETVLPRWFIGLASGSSADGVDAALIETEGVGLDLRARLIHALHYPYPPDVRSMIVGISSASIKQASLLHRVLGETFAAAARGVADQASFSLQKAQCIGCAGHTIWHEPEGRFPSTFGLGMAAVVAERTGVTTVSDFRARDLAAGGLGMPMATLADYLLFRNTAETLAVVHLGSLATIAYLPASGRLQEAMGFEAGPCNVLLDGLMGHLTGGRETFDAGGKHAVQGRCIDSLLQRWLGHPYLQRRPPKSLPRHGFGEEFVAQASQLAKQMSWSLHDLLCTATHFVARGITQAIARFLPQRRPPDRVLMSGGGVRNGFLWHLIAQQLEPVPVRKTDEAGVPAQARKALIFGLLAALTIDGVPASLASATGATGARLLGSLTPGSPASWARCLSWMASQTMPPAAAA
jgi:anhydro-N-acetylmuramic acid kinase